jgi:hypothetical protein
VAKRRAPFNVFYAVRIVVGVVFALTAFAYFVMAARARNAARVETSMLMSWMDEYGGLILAAELGALAVATVGAIAWDHYFDRRESYGTTGIAKKREQE